MTTEEKFNAAVNVIKNLPKNGTYQPSKELMLKFYSYYKQATEGPCNIPKPGFWDLVQRAKWYSWNSLGNMNRLEAMELYVEELKKIVETMSYNENVGNFLGSLDSFYEMVPAEDLELIAGELIQKIRAHADNGERNQDNIEDEDDPVTPENERFVNIDKPTSEVRKCNLRNVNNKPCEHTKMKISEGESDINENYLTEAILMEIDNFHSDLNQLMLRIYRIKGAL